MAGTIESILLPGYGLIVERASRAMMARLEELAADGARTTGVLMKLISHVPNLAKPSTAGGPGRSI